MANKQQALFEPLELRCGVVLKNRIIKAAMSDSLGDGKGNPSDLHYRLYQRWAEGGVAASLIGEVQINPYFAEKPGNLVLNKASDNNKFSTFVKKSSVNSSLLWTQLGHAGALAHPPISKAKGPSVIDVPELQCKAFTKSELQELSNEYAESAALAKKLGFTGVQIHAAHGFLLSQFLSPLFNKRNDEYGGSILSRAKLLYEIIDAVREAVGPSFPVILKINSSDQLEGGLIEEDSLAVIASIDNTKVDLIEISGGTYYPGAKAASDSASNGAYFTEFAKQAKTKTNIPLMLTGGFKTFSEANHVVSKGYTDVVGLARALALQPDLVNNWKKTSVIDPTFPRFDSPPTGGITAWYSMRLTDIALDKEAVLDRYLSQAVLEYDNRDAIRSRIWINTFF